jgi:hypothetical protein
MRSSVATGSGRATRAGSAILAGSALLAVVNAGAIAVAVPVPAEGVALRVSHHVFDVAETLGVGVLAALGVAAFVGIARLPRWCLGLVSFVVWIAIVARVAGDDLLAWANAFQVRSTTMLWLAEIVLLAALLAASPYFATACTRRGWLLLLPVALSVGALTTDQIVRRDDYADLHGLVALGGVLLGGAALAPTAERKLRTLARDRKGKAALLALAVFALFGIIVPPPNATRFELFRQPCAVAPWILASALWDAPRLHPPLHISPERIPGASPIAPTIPPVLPPNAVVVLITIDAVRADVVSDPANEARFPTLTKLKTGGVDFTHAVAQGTQTGVSLAALFSGRYFSEERWTPHGSGRSRQPYPASDVAPRFPELLSEHGVETVNYASLLFLGGDYGIARGFREERVLGMSSRGASGQAVVSALIERLERADDASLFVYAHLLEPHAPYTVTRKLGPGSDYERYLSMIAVSDALVGRVVDRLEQHFEKRWALLLCADHGEAFGDHETREHGKTLYEELLRVPLLAYGPALRPRVVDVPVGLIDLGPTLLDLFGVPTPPTSHGQSLVPLLAGDTVALTRPLLAEGRLRRSLTEPDGLKVIEDLRRKTVEVYDLNLDPGETRNLWDVDTVRSEAALADLRAFFATHAWRLDGYEPPYKR